MRRILKKIFPYFFVEIEKEQPAISEILMLPSIVQELVKLIGEDNAFKVWETFSRKQIYFPRYQQIDYVAKYKEIIKRFNSGESIKKLAKSYKVTETWIYEIIREKSQQ